MRLPSRSIYDPLLSKWIRQKLNDICKSILRFEEGEEKNPPAKAFDLPNSGDCNTPTGAARFMLLKMFLPMAVKLRE